jgi:hypothetical protein
MGLLTSLRMNKVRDVIPFDKRIASLYVILIQI